MTTLSVPAARFQQFARSIAAAFSTTASGDVWRLYRLAGNADSVSPAAVKALATLS